MSPSGSVHRQWLNATAACALLACGIGSAGGLGPASGPDALELALSRAHPEVEHWDIHPLLGSVVRADLLAGGEVVQLGARSAVRLSDGSLRWYAVHGVVQGLVAQRELAAHLPLAAADWVPGRVDALDEACEPLVHWPTDAALRLRRSVASGASLCRELTEAMPVVRRGDPVILVAQSGAVAVRSEGTALTDAAIGDALSVKARGTGRVIHGRATAPSEVSIDAHP